MAKSKKVRKYIELKKQADRAQRSYKILRDKELEAFDALSGTEVREYQRMIRDAAEAEEDR